MGEVSPEQRLPKGQQSWLTRTCNRTGIKNVPEYQPTIAPIPRVGGQIHAVSTPYGTQAAAELTSQRPLDSRAKSAFELDLILRDGFTIPQNNEGEAVTQWPCRIGSYISKK